MNRSQRLGLAMAISVLVHGALLTAFPVRPQRGARSPDVSLNIVLEQPDTDAVARPGQAEEPEKRFAPPLRPAPAASAASAASAPPVPVPAESRDAQPPAPKPATVSPDDLRLRSMEMIRREVTDPFAGKRVRNLSAQTRDEVFGPYEEAYRQKVEQVGSVNYPPPVAGRRLYGVVRLTATIRQDGTLALVEIKQSSGSPDLDDAARRIVRMAAPFQPFTPAMRAETDLVSITRSFNFIRAGEAIHSQ